MAKIKMSPNIPDINTHEFTIYALNDIYDMVYKMQKTQRRRRRASSLKFITGMTVLYLSFRNLNNRLKEVEKGTDTAI